MEKGKVWVPIAWTTTWETTCRHFSCYENVTANFCHLLQHSKISHRACISSILHNITIPIINTPWHSNSWGMPFMHALWDIKKYPNRYQMLQQMEKICCDIFVAYRQETCHDNFFTTLCSGSRNRNSFKRQSLDNCKKVQLTTIQWTGQIMIRNVVNQKLSSDQVICKSGITICRSQRNI